MVFISSTKWLGKGSSWTSLRPWFICARATRQRGRRAAISPPRPSLRHGKLGAAGRPRPTAQLVGSVLGGGLVGMDAAGDGATRQRIFVDHVRRSSWYGIAGFFLSLAIFNHCEFPILISWVSFYCFQIGYVSMFRRSPSLLPQASVSSSISASMTSGMEI